MPSWNLEEDTGGLHRDRVLNITGHAGAFHVPEPGRGTRDAGGSESGRSITGPDRGQPDRSFHLADSTFGDIDEGMRSAVALHDFHGTGDLDLVTGNYRGMGFWRNDFSVGIAGEVDSRSAPAVP